MTTTTTKRPRCAYCQQRGGKRHLDACARPRKAASTHPMPPPIQAPPPPAVKLRNHAILVIDGSGSMQGLRPKVEEVVNAQISELRTRTQATGQETTLSIYQFANDVRLLTLNTPIFAVTHFSGYRPDGNTALLDAVGKAISDHECMPDASDPNTSFLMIIVTDGQENWSRAFTAASLKAKMQNVIRTDRWTFVFSGPKGSGAYMLHFGVEPGNIQEWETTVAGLTSLGAQLSGGVVNYYAGRATGQRRISNFFQPDLTRISQQAITALDDLANDFRTWDVTTAIDITAFVNNKLMYSPQLANKIGNTYQMGRGYYELTKAEEVQANKDFLLLDTNTNAVYGGNQARALIGCPIGHSFKIKPGNHAGYRIFIRSTSTNRKLVPGTKFLYNVK